MDNYFTSALLLLALATHDIFAVGTLRGKRAGLDGAEQLWKNHEMVTKDRGNMLFARSDELVVIEWVDLKKVNLMSTKHIFEEDWSPLPYTWAHQSYITRRAVQNRDTGVASLQPRACLEYVAKMGGVDVANQRLGAHTHDHKPKTFFWCRVFDQNLVQAISNAHLIFAAWAGVLADQCATAILVADGGDVGVGGATVGGAKVTDDSDLSRGELDELSGLVKKCLKMERVAWDRRLSTHIMALCNVGHTNKGARCIAPVVPSYNSTSSKSARCCSVICTSEGKYRTKCTAALCWCNICSGKKGKARTLYLYHECQQKKYAHIAAAEAANKKTKYRPIDWVS